MFVGVFKFFFIFQSSFLNSILDTFGAIQTRPLGGKEYAASVSILSKPPPMGSGFEILIL